MAATSTYCCRRRRLRKTVALFGAILYCLPLVIFSIPFTNCEEETSLTSDKIVQVDSDELDSFKAIRSLHSTLDVDADGEVDDLESKKFLTDNKNVAQSTSQKLSYLHQDGKDRSISVQELWDAWKISPVHNWTMDEAIYWLENCVELPEYASIFQSSSINGTLMPRLAADSQFLNKLGITDPAAKKRISIKAIDVVLFGPPKQTRSSLLRDSVVGIVTLIALSLCMVFYKRSIASQEALQALQGHLESLERVEDQVQKSLQANSERPPAPLSLRQLLKATYDIESQYYQEKKMNLETKATEVKLRNQKLQKKKTSFLGYYKMAQENSLEEDINTIVEVKEAIMQVSREMKERAERWKAIEEHCNCSLDLSK